MRTSPPDNCALGAKAHRRPSRESRNRWTYSVATLPLDPIACKKIDAGYKAILDQLLPSIQIEIKRRVRWTNTLIKYAIYLRGQHWMTYEQVADHLNFAYGTDVFTIEAITAALAAHRRSQRVLQKNNGHQHNAQ